MPVWVGCAAIMAAMALRARVNLGTAGVWAKLCGVAPFSHFKSQQS